MTMSRGIVVAGGVGGGDMTVVEMGGVSVVAVEPVNAVESREVRGLVFIIIIVPMCTMTTSHSSLGVMVVVEGVLRMPLGSSCVLVSVVAEGGWGGSEGLIVVGIGRSRLMGYTGDEIMRTRRVSNGWWKG